MLDKINKYCNVLKYHMRTTADVNKQDVSMKMRGLKQAQQITYRSLRNIALSLGDQGR